MPMPHNADAWMLNNNKQISNDLSISDSYWSGGGESNDSIQIDQVKRCEPK